jgi:hypothetical protein
LKNKYIFTLYGSHEDEYFVQLPYQASNRLAVIYQTTNFNYKQSIGANVVIPFHIGNKLHSRLLLNEAHHRAKSNRFHDLSFDKSKWVSYAKLENTLTVSSKPDIKMEFSAAYLTPSIQGPIDLSAIWTADAGLKWTFAGKKAELRLKGTDLFNTWMPDLGVQYANQNLQMKIRPDTRAISLSFVYKFGGEAEKKDRKEVDTSRFGKQ